MSTIKKKLNTVSIDIGCSSCLKPKLSEIFNPKPKHHKSTTNYNNLYYHSSSSSSSKTNISPSTFSPATETPSHHDDTVLINKSKTVKGFGRVGGETVAMEKDSDDPYLDFRHSMLQMILEKQIYSKHDLRELLNCFLQLNSPHHHGIILRAFTEIWNGVFSVRSSSDNTDYLNYFGYNSRDYYYY